MDKPDDDIDPDFPGYIVVRDYPGPVGWFRRALGIDCCGEWSKWEIKQKTCKRPPATHDEKRAYVYDLIIYVEKWQERHCTACGKIQQKTLEY